MRRVMTLAAAFAAFLALVGCERAKTKLDREVDRLCAIDGGVHIYETVTLPKENFGPDGEVFPQYRTDVVHGGGLGPKYKWESTKQEIVQGNPSLTRWEQKVIRVKDEKILGRRIVYIRGGGDVMGPWAPSEYSCQGVPNDLVQQIFVRENLK